MQKYSSAENTVQEVESAHGPWSAMAIQIAPETYTKEDQVDWRLRRLVQVAADAVGKPLSQCRVLDLACLEGHYAIEFALHGAEAVGVELREANIAKAAFAAQQLNLETATFYLDDVNNLNVEQYGTFDIIICSGILYHLRAEDACALIGKMRACCSGIMLLDTYIAAHPRQTVKVAGRDIHGAPYIEHVAGASKEERLSDLWASVDNEQSFWLAEESLLGVVQDAGFSSCMEIMTPVFGGSFDRRTYLAFAGTPVEVLSSERTRQAAAAAVPRRDPADVHPQQKPRSLVFKFAKRYLPQGAKDLIKPTLRKMGVLDTKDAPFAAAAEDRSGKDS